MAKLRGILLTDLPNDDELDDLVKVAKLHLSAADTVMKVQVRVDENRLRRKQNDILPAILEILREEKRKLAPLLEMAAS